MLILIIADFLQRLGTLGGYLLVCSSEDSVPAGLPPLRVPYRYAFAYHSYTFCPSLARRLLQTIKNQEALKAELVFDVILLPVTVSSKHCNKLVKLPSEIKDVRK